MTEDKFACLTTGLKKAYELGYQYGKSGQATKENCHFSCFATTELLKEWERGKAQGVKERLEAEELKP